MEGRANPLESVAASLRDPGKNYPRSIRKRFAETIVETRSRTEEGRSHEQPVKLYEVAINGLLRVSHQVKRAVNGLSESAIKRPDNISSKLPAERQDGRWCDEGVPHYPRRYHIVSDGTA